MDDTGQAQVIRREAQEELREIRRQAPAITRLTKALAQRRELNHFGEEIEITFKPREVQDEDDVG